MLIKKILLSILNVYIRRNKFLVKLFFNIRLPDGERIFWDFTTLTLKSVLDRIVTPQTNILEIGTGPYALLSVYLNKKYKCNSTASDINKKYTSEAKICSIINETRVNVLESDLFKNITGKYDIIFFNSVYIAEKKGIELGLDGLHKYRTDWCGGESGYEITEKYLSDAKEYLMPSGCVILGYNPLYLKPSEINGLCIRLGYSIEHEYKKFLNPSTVLILK